MFNNIPELLPTNSFQYSATKYAFRALTSGYIDCDCLIHVKSHTLKSITGKNIKLKTEPEEIYSSLVSHLSKITHDQPSKDLDHNCQLLANGLALPRNSWRFLKLMTVIDSNGGLKSFLQEILSCDSNFHPIFASMVNIEEQELITIINAMNSLGVFERICLISLEFLWLPQPIINKLLGTKVNDYFELIAPIIQSQDASALRLKDFEHLSPDTMVKFIDIALNNSMPGVNVLLYGLPGVGKSEFAKVIADKTGAALVAIRALGDDAHNLDGQLHTNNTSSNLRLQYHQLVQRLIPKQEKTLLLVEECEDVFYQSHSIRNLNKDYLNRFVENNTVPTVWITNHISEIPESCIRRFTFVQQVEVPDNRVMNNIIAKEFKGLYLSKDFKQKLASNTDIVPAHISNAALVAHHVEQTGKVAESTIESMVNSKLIACGNDVSPAKYRAQLVYSTEFLNIQGGQQTISQLTFAAKNNSPMRILMVGEPGTGKSAFAQYLADKLGNGRELMTIKPSDVLDKFVGGTETNISRVFAEAHQKNAIIFLDEVDSLISSRESLSNQFERQAVNQILIEIDQSEIMILLASNFAQNLDKALLRRMDFKLTLDYLTSTQVIKLYEKSFGHCSCHLREQLSKLTRLTPGSFAVAKRRNTFSKAKLSDIENLEILTTENNQTQQSKSIGFIN